MCMVAQSNKHFTRLLVGDQKRILEMTITLSELISPSLFQLDTLTMGFCPAPGWANFVHLGGSWLEIIIIIAVGGLGLLLGDLPSHTRRRHCNGAELMCTWDRG